MKTDDLTRNLARDLEPVVPLRRPAARAARWVVAAGLYVVLLAAGMSMVNGFAAGAGAAFWAAQIGAVVTSVLASAAAFSSVVPGASNRPALLALVAAALWVAALALPSAAADWSALSSATHEWWCVAFIVGGGAPLLAALALLLRRGAPLRPATTAALAALSVAALANVGACIALPHANNAITVTWHGGVIVAATAAAAVCGRLLFSWRRVRSQRATEG